MKIVVVKKENKIKKSDQNRQAPKKKRGRRFKFFAVLFGFLGFTGLVLIGVVLSLPTIVSTDSVRRIVIEQASKALNRPVTIEQLRWGWTSGFVIRKLQVAEDAHFATGPMFAVDALNLDIAYLKLLSREVKIDLAISGLQAAMIRDKAGVTNIDHFLEGLPKSKPKAPAPKVEPAPESKKKTATAPWEAIAFKMPVNISVAVNLDQIRFAMTDRKNNKRFEIKEAGIRLGVPSLFEQPVTLGIASDFFIDDRPLPEAKIDLLIQKLFKTDGQLDLPAAMAELKVQLPGVQMNLDTNLPLKQVKSHLALDLPEIFKLAGPFLPENLQTAKISGKIDLGLDAIGDPLERMEFKNRLNVSELGLAGGPLKQKQVKPIDLNLVNNAVLNVVDGQVEKIDGRLDILTGSHLNWSGTIKQIKTKQPQADFKLGPLHLDLAELLPKVSDFIPEMIRFPKASPAASTDAGLSLTIEAVNFQGPLPPDHCQVAIEDMVLSIPDFIFENKKQRINPQQTEISLDHLEFKGQLKKGKSKAALKNFQIKLPEFQAQLDQQNIQIKTTDFRLKTVTVDLVDLKPVKNDLTAGLKIGALALSSKQPSPQAIDISGVDLQIDQLNASLAEMFPTQADVDIGLAVSSFKMAGAQTVTCNGLQLDELLISARNIEKQKETLAGLTADLTLKNRLGIDLIDVSPKVNVSDVNQKLSVKCRLLEKQAAKVVLESLTIHAEKISAPLFQGAEKATTIECGADLDLQVDGIDIARKSAITVDIQNARIKSNIEDALSLDIEASLTDTGKSRLDSIGQLQLNLTALSQKFLSVLSPKIIPEMKLTGTSALEWQFAGRLPTADETKQLKTPTFNLKSDFAWLERFDLKHKLDNISVEMAMPKKQKISIASISSREPLHYALQPASEKGELSLSLVADGISQLPAQQLDPPLNLKIDLKGSHQGFKSIRIEQSLNTTPIEVNQTFSAVLENIDRLLKKADFTPATLLNVLNGQVTVRADISGNEALDTALKDIKIDGKVSAGAEMKLISGRMLGAKTWVLSQGINARLPERFSVSKLRSNLLIDKSFKIQTATHKDQILEADALPALSTRVMQPPSTDLSSTEGGLSSDRLVASQAGRRFIGELKEKFNSLPSIAFQSALVGKPPNPLQINPTKLEFKMDQGLPEIRYFQTDILGGTITGALSVIEEEHTFFLRTQLSFSGIDSSRMLPAVKKVAAAEETEINGQLLLYMPLVTKMKPLKEKFWLDLQFTHIGSRTIERFLLAMDPTESNEAIVSQRKLLSNGSPRWIKVAVKDSELSLEGQLDIRGAKIEPLHIDPINISNLERINQFEHHLLKLLPILEALRVSSAETLAIDKSNNTMIFK